MWRWVGYNPLSFIKRFPRTTFHGFEPHIRSMSFVFSRYKHGPLRFYYYDPEVMETWKDMLDRTLADSIKVAFAFSPMYSYVVYAKGEEERLHEVIDSLAGSYGIPVLDYSHSPICSDSTLFQDFNHLNQNGAVVYSDSIARDLSRLGFFD